MHQGYRIFVLGCFLLARTTTWAQTNNFVISRSYKQTGIPENFNTANSSQASTQVSYFDGLGKPTQTIMAFQAGSKGDVVTLTEYDNQQRPVRSYLPAPLATNGGAVQLPDNIKAQARTYYQDGSRVSAPIDPNAPSDVFTAQTTYENAPLNRMTAQKAPGAANAISQEHGVNGDGEVKLYQINGTGLTAVQLQGNYSTGALTFVRTTDENESVVTDFKDRKGQTVLKRVRLTTDINLDTYYVYDEKDQLRAVLQPKYALLGENDPNKNAFLYRYDDRGRLVEKKVPGANAVQMTYRGDTDLLETSTDGRGTVFYYKYDNLNRQIEMGVKPNGVETPLLYTYYDTYNFDPFQSYTNELNIGAVEFAGNPNQPRTGLQTGSKARILKADGTFGEWLQTVMYYDDKYRIIQTVRQLYGFSSAAYERVSHRLAFDGKSELEWTTQVTGSVTYKLAKTYDYDHANRLIKTKHTFYENDVQKKAYTHVENLYNELGQLSAKSLHGGRQILTYKQTPRGWLGDHQTTHGKPFALNLTYQDNGNITRQSWVTNSYSGSIDLSYDKANRLSGALGTGGFLGYHESPILYDRNGNITNLNRTYSNTMIDQLNYQYHGNQLHRVDDDNDNQAQAVKGFINGANVDDEMVYDNNGNLTRDNNRSITNISYNVLNLPRSVARNGRTVLYTYDATGAKHKSEAPDNVNTFYAGAFEYRAENSLLRIGLEEGQLVKDGTSYMVHYYLRDHLANIRSVMNEAGTIIQETEYYAFGLPIQRTGGDKNKYLYNGKERQPETEWLDYGARMYDPTIGRWMTVDPLSEISRRWSPFGYVYNNPLRFIDPDGMAAEDLGDKVRYTGSDALALYNSLTAKEGQREEPQPKPARLARTNQERQQQAQQNYDQMVARGDGIEYDNTITGAVIGGEVFKPVGAILGRVLGRLWGRAGTKAVEQTVDDAAKTSSNVLLNTSRQLQAKFKHAEDFGVLGNYSKANAGKFSSAINQHINSAGVQTINGTYRGQSVVHYLNTNTGLNVISSPSGQFISGWKLNPAQLQNVLKHGGL